MKKIIVAIHFYIAVELLSTQLLTSANCVYNSEDRPYFIWENGVPFFLDDSLKMCKLIADWKVDEKTGSTALTGTNSLKLNVLSFGDSYEQGLCFNQPTGRVLSYIKRPGHTEHLYTHCSKNSESIQYYVRRTFGQNGTTEYITKQWYMGNNSSVDVIKEMGRHLTENLRIENKTAATSTGIDAVIHGSFLWDMKHWHYNWCHENTKHCMENATSSIYHSRMHSRHHNDKMRNMHDTSATTSKPTAGEDNTVLFTALCNHATAVTNINELNYKKKCGPAQKQHNGTSKASVHINMQIELLLQSWERLTMPWCDAAILRQWQQTYLREVHALLDAFPDSALFLRTQPISSAVFLGNFRCHKPMNDFIAHVVRSFQQQPGSSSGRNDTNFRVRDSSGELHNSSNSISDGSAYTVDFSSFYGKRQVRLIDLYSLFAAPNDNGVDHFSPDNVHLTVEGFKVYRAYIYRVLNDFYRDRL